LEAERLGMNEFPEGYYTLNISETKMTIKANDYSGYVHGLVTFA